MPVINGRLSTFTFRADKEKLEQKCANLQESLAHSRRELAKTKEQMQSLESEHCQAKERADTLEQVCLLNSE